MNSKKIMSNSSLIILVLIGFIALREVRYIMQLSATFQEASMDEQTSNLRLLAMNNKNNAKGKGTAVDETTGSSIDNDDDGVNNNNNGNTNDNDNDNDNDNSNDSYSSEPASFKMLREAAVMRSIPKLPNVLLIGFQKCGTTAISDWLFNSGVCHAQPFHLDPEYFGKEVHFFDDEDRYNQGVRWYAKRFEHCFRSPESNPLLAASLTVNVTATANDTLFGNNNTTTTSEPASLPVFAMDATPNTIQYPDRVHKLYSEAGGDQVKNAKIILILREPISRELSLYNHKASFFWDDHDRAQWYADVARTDGSIMSFDEYANFKTQQEINMKTSYSLYAYHLKRWMEYFQREQILVLSYDELKKKPTQIQQRITDFLGYNLPMSPIRVQNSVNCLQCKEGGGSGYNKTKLPSCTIQNQLFTSTFQKENEEFYRLLESHPGPQMEQRPFPRFKLSNCTEEVKKVSSISTNATQSKSIE